MKEDPPSPRLRRDKGEKCAEQRNAIKKEELRRRKGEGGRKHCGMRIDSRSPDRSVASPCNQCGLPGGVPARRVAECGVRIPGTESNSIEAELFADRLRKRVLDLSVPRYRRNSAVHWIRVKIVI